MSYTIAVLKGGSEKRDRIQSLLSETLLKDGRFRLNSLRVGEVHLTRAERCESWAMGDAPALLIKGIRLTAAKSYCGNHPGECPVDGRPKPTSSFLEWDDYVAFNTLVNRVLNRVRASANVWSLPYDVRGKMWVRQGTFPRIKWDWTERMSDFHRVIRVWNQGTPDQFSTKPYSFQG